MSLYGLVKYGAAKYGENTPQENFELYLYALKNGYIFNYKLEFLNPDGTIAFIVKKDFIQEGSLNVSFQNGTRRTANVTLENTYKQNAIDINKIWFGQQIRLLAGTILPNGVEYYIPQGVFYIKDPDETFEPNLKTVNLELIDKWSYLDGTLHGNLEGNYIANINDLISQHVSKILQLDRGNGVPIDNVTPLISNCLINKTTTLPDGSITYWNKVPYTMRKEADNNTYADVLLEFNTMYSGVIGYNNVGVLCIEPSNQDLSDAGKPVLWKFDLTSKEFLGMKSSHKQSSVYNDIIVVGAIANGKQAKGRAENNDISSTTSIQRIGRKTLRIVDSKYVSDAQCKELAEWQLKRKKIKEKSITFKTTPIYHLIENRLIELNRLDDNISQRYLIGGFSMPISQIGQMSINATSINEI
ncbi:MAG: hypothetical protein AB9836_04415 [Aminipila sp.]